MIVAPLHLQKLIGKEFASEEYSQLKMDSQPWKKVYFREHLRDPFSKISKSAIFSRGPFGSQVSVNETTLRVRFPNIIVFAFNPFVAANAIKVQT